MVFQELFCLGKISGCLYQKLENLISSFVPKVCDWIGALCAKKVLLSGGGEVNNVFYVGKKIFE